MTVIDEIERLIRRDPARRGLISSEDKLPPLCLGHLQEAAEHLARAGSHVAIVTGFFVPQGEPPAAETDGPLGALMLARALEACDMETRLVTDRRCADALSVAAQAAEYPSERILAYPGESPRWRDEFYTSDFGRQLSHLVAIERVGPSHTEDSFLRQGGHRRESRELDRFRRLVPSESWNRCHNMRGRVIDEYTADLHRLFEELPLHRPDARTIGIGDGGNEIGMGAIPWEDLVRRLDGEVSARIPCRIAADWTIIAGTSNWGGYALAAATLFLRDRHEFLRSWTSLQEYAVLERLVRNGPAVDGVTRRQEATVDGLPLLTYIQVWEGIRQTLGFH